MRVERSQRDDGQYVTTIVHPCDPRGYIREWATEIEETYHNEKGDPDAGVLCLEFAENVLQAIHSDHENIDAVLDVLAILADEYGGISYEWLGDTEVRESFSNLTPEQDFRHGVDHAVAWRLCQLCLEAELHRRDSAALER